ncbi:hypothetical protein DFP73DRAFT_610056 [Morchella snyderi]|nr:hypothetical protein DFP73DRAFT_610056 [Morchella snyderi]
MMYFLFLSSSSLLHTSLVYGMAIGSLVPVSEADNVNFDPSGPGFNVSESISQTANDIDPSNPSFNVSESIDQTANVNDTAQELDLGDSEHSPILSLHVIPPWVTCEASNTSPLLKGVIALPDYMFIDKNV